MNLNKGEWLMKLSKNSWLNIIGISIIFLTPWTHRLAYENITKAWPNIDPLGGHLFAMVAAVISLMIIFINRDWDYK